jgi:hypothetical protein
MIGEAVARVRQDSEEENRAGLKERMMRGRGRSRRWTAAVCTAAARGGAAPVAEQKSRGAKDRGGLEEEEEREEVRGTGLSKPKTSGTPQ